MLAEEQRVLVPPVSRVKIAEQQSEAGVYGAVGGVDVLVDLEGQPYLVVFVCLVEEAREG